MDINKTLAIPIVFLVAVFYSSDVKSQYLVKDSHPSNGAYMDDWEHVYKHPIKLENASYFSGDPFIIFKTEDGEDSLKVFYRSGEVWVKGTGFSFKKNKLVPNSGIWEIYYANNKLKERVEYRRGMRFGDYLRLDEEGNVIKKRNYQQRYAFGFSTSVFGANLSIDSGKDTTMNAGSFGWEVGFPIYYRLSDRLAMRTLPSISYCAYDILVRTAAQSKKEILKDYTAVKLPIAAVVSLYHGFNVVVGASFNHYVGEKNPEDPILFSSKNFDFSGELGISYNFEFDLFTMVPELMYSKQLTNSADFKPIAYSSSVNELKKSQYTFSLLFIAPGYVK